MARTIGFTQTFTANQLVAQIAGVNDSRFNPVERNSRVSLYAAVSGVAAGASVSLALGSDTHADLVPAQVSALSTRDNLITTGIALAGQKITVTAQETGGVATTVLAGLIVIEPIS